MMERLKSFLITRLLLVLAAIMAAEAGCSWLVRRVLLPYAALLAEYGQEVRIPGAGEMFQVMRELLRGNSGAVMSNLLSRSAVLFILLISVLLLLLPVVLGVLWYSGLAANRIDQLQRTREKEREELDAQRNLMFSDFAHDLRTPIMTISGYSGALADGMVKDEAQQKEYLEAIRVKAGRMSELINLLFEYTKLGSVNFSLKKEATDLNELLRTVTASVYDDLEQAGIELLIEIPEHAFTVQADPAQISRVFHNLIINVARHNPAGTKAAVSVKRMAGQELVAVADTGVRIEKSAKELFEPFVKGDDSRSESSGSGLGLSIAKKITEMHGWEIDLVQPFGTYTKAFVVKVPER